MPELLATAVAALGGSERSGQIEMAEAVARAFDTGEHLAVQAGTGTGKSLAYLVPAIAARPSTTITRSWCPRRRSRCSASSSTATCPGWPTRWPARCPADRSSRCSRAAETTCA